MTEPESGCSMETPARTPLHQTTRALRLSALLRIQRSTSWRGITGSENSSIAPFRDRFRTRQSMVEDRPLNTIRPARYVRRLSLLRCSFILRSLFGTARGFYLWFSNGRANLNLLRTLRTAFHDERFTPRPRKPCPLRVKMRKPHYEQMSSALRLGTDITSYGRSFSSLQMPDGMFDT